MTDDHKKLLESLSVADIAQMLLFASKKEDEEYDSIVDSFEALKEENYVQKSTIEKLELTISNLSEKYNRVSGEYTLLKRQCDTVARNAEKHLISAKQACRERDQKVDELVIANDIVSRYKQQGTPKGIRDKIKDQKERIAADLTSIDAYKKRIKDYRREIDNLVDEKLKLQVSERQSNITTVWSKNGDNLMIFPAKLSMKVGDHVEKQITLLFMDNSGCGKLIGLDEDGEPKVCNMPKGGLKPKAETLRVSGEMLRKWRRNDWKLDTSDLDLAFKAQ